jgi:hypothetical protein
VLKYVEAAELRDTSLLPVYLQSPPDAVLAAHHLPKPDTHLATALARLHEKKKLERRSRLEAGSTRDKKGGEERRNARNYVKRWHARIYPERETEVLFCLLATDSYTKVMRKRGACGKWPQLQSPASVQAVARGAARCVSQVLGCGAQVAARGASRFESQVLDRFAPVSTSQCVAGT